MEEYKYLGCMLNDQLNCASIVEERAKAGAKALSNCMRRCRVVVGELRSETFVKLLEMLVWGSVEERFGKKFKDVRVGRIKAEGPNSLSMSEVRQMLRDVASREVWRVEGKKQEVTQS